MGKRLYIQMYNAVTGESITLPVNPETIELPKEKDIKTYNILNYGEVAIKGNRQLQRFTLSGLLPSDDSYFGLLASLIKQLNYKPYSLTETRSWQRSLTVRFICWIPIRQWKMSLNGETVVNWKRPAEKRSAIRHMPIWWKRKR